MRIVGGRHRGRPLRAPGGRDSRPTSDRAREAIFNILAHGMEDFELDGASVVDVFAGTGALGLEALSRGAAHATFIDDDGRAMGCVRGNAAALGERGAVTLLTLDAARLPPPPLAARAPCALAFLDPPYGAGLAAAALEGLAGRGWIAPGAVCVVELAAPEPFTPPPAFEAVDERTYGPARVVFLRWRPEDKAPTS
jgi:16S rRNA (guanine966-N2)-methyltransferase